MTTVRLPLELEQKLETFSEILNKTKSEIIKDALEHFFYRQSLTKDSYDLGKDLFGQVGSGDGRLSQNYKAKLKEKIRAKQRSH